MLAEDLVDATDMMESGGLVPAVRWVDELREQAEAERIEAAWNFPSE